MEGSEIVLDCLILPILAVKMVMETRTLELQIKSVMILVQGLALVASLAPLVRTAILLATC
jgi:hypothetical protein